MRRALTAFLILILVAVGADYAVWRWATFRLADGYAQWVHRAGASGWLMKSGTPARAGWPFAAELVLPEATLTGGRADLPGGIAWHAAVLRLRITPGNPRELAIIPAGEQSLTVGGQAPVAFSAGQMTIETPLMDQQPEAGATVDAIALHVTPPGYGAASVERLHARIGWLPTMAISLTAGTIALPSGFRWAFGNDVQSFAMIATLRGAPPQAAAPGLAAMAAAWRDAGGRMDIQKGALRWGALRLDASADLGLDEAMQPEGTGTARITDPGPALDALDASHALPQRAVTAAKAFLTLLEQPAANGAPPYIVLPAALARRTLSIAHVPVAKVPELIWPAAP